MTRIQEADPKTFRAVERGVQKLTRGCATLEEAAQRYTALLYESFGEGIVLARLFATVPYGELPATNQRFVDELASGAGVGEKITPETLVLSLLGTSGVEPEWNDRRRSRGHVGIPLASAEFVGAIPMVARLLHELGLGFDWIDRADSDAVLKTLGSINGVFYVDDASTAVDVEGRKIIPASDFVEKYGVRSVVGVGGAYVGTPTFVAAILFCRENVTRERAEAFMAHINRLKASTMHLVAEGTIFADEASGAAD
ncbi:MAG: hypothetical protein KC486_18250 [Myxococcales bacterium]|nr:hypothetical protein [Myxococcales bacterium]